MQYSVASDLGLYCLWHWSDGLFCSIWSGTILFTTLIRCHNLRHLIWDYTVYDTDQMAYSAASDLGLYCLGHWSDAIFCGFRSGTILFMTLIRWHILRHLIWDYTVNDTDQMPYSAASDLGLYCLGHWSDAIFCGIWSGTILFTTLIRCNILWHLIWDYTVYDTDQMPYSAASDLGLYCLRHWSDAIFCGIWSGTKLFMTLIRCNILRHLIWDYTVYDTDQMQYSAASDLGLYCLWQWSDAIFCSIWSGTILFMTLIRCNILRHLIWDYTVYDWSIPYSAASDLGLYCLGHWSDAIFCGTWSGTILFTTLIRCHILQHLIWDYTV